MSVLFFRFLRGNMANNTTEMNVTASMPTVTPRNPFDITPRWYPACDIPLALFYFVVVLCGTGNWLIALTIALHKKLRKPFNALVAMLACVYGLITLVVAPMELVELSHKLAGESWLWCKVKIILRTGVFYNAMLLLLAIAIIRLAHGLTTKKIDLRCQHIIMICILIALPAVTLTLMSSSDRGVTMMTCRNDIVGLLMAIQQFGELEVIFIPTVIIFVSTVISYIALIITLKIRDRLIAQNQNQPKRKFHIVTSRVAFWVITGFCVSYLCPFISKLVQIWWQPSLQELPHNMAAYNAALFIQATVHPLIHFRQNVTFRVAVKRVLLRPCCKVSKVGPGNVNQQPAPPHN